MCAKCRAVSNNGIIAYILKVTWDSAKFLKVLPFIGRLQYQDINPYELMTE